MTGLAQVAVENTVYHFDKLFTYRVPEPLQDRVRPGVRVMVPFGTGNRERVGMVFALGGQEEGRLKAVHTVLDKEPVLDGGELALALWMKNRYFCTLFSAVKQMIPAGLQFRVRDSYLLDHGFTDFDREVWDGLSWQIITALRTAGKAVPFEKLSRALGITQDNPAFQALLEKGVVCKVNLAMSRVQDAVAKMVRPVTAFDGKLTPRQREVYQALLDVGEATEKELCYFTGASSGVVKALAAKGAAEVFEYELYRRPEQAAGTSGHLEDLVLSPSQQRALDGLCREFEQAREGRRCALLYGVAGRGKTSFP